MKNDDYLLCEIVGFLRGLSLSSGDIGKHLADVSAKYHDRLDAYIEQRKEKDK